MLQSLFTAVNSLFRWEVSESVPAVHAEESRDLGRSTVEGASLPGGHPGSQSSNVTRDELVSRLHARRSQHPGLSASAALHVDSSQDGWGGTLSMPETAPGKLGQCKVKGFWSETIRTAANTTLKTLRSVRESILLFTQLVKDENESSSEVFHGKHDVVTQQLH